MSIPKKRILYLFIAVALIITFIASSMTVHAAPVKFAYDTDGTCYIIPNNLDLETAINTFNYIEPLQYLSPRGNGATKNGGASYVWGEYKAELEAAGFNERSFKYAYESILLDKAGKQFETNSAGELVVMNSYLGIQDLYDYLFVSFDDKTNAETYAEKYKKYKDDGSTQKKDDSSSGNGGNSSSDDDNEWIKHMSPVTEGSGDEAQTALETGAGILVYVVETFGAFALVSGFCTFILAAKDDRPESKQKAIIAIVVGALLVSFTALLQALTIIE